MTKLNIFEAIDFIAENSGRYGTPGEKAQEVAEELKAQIRDLDTTDADLDDIEIFI